MGTAVVKTDGIELAKVVEVLKPGGEYETGRLALKREFEHAVLEAAKVTSITTHEEAEHATILGRILQDGSKRTEAFFKGFKQQVDAIKAPLLAAEKIDIQPLESGKQRIGAFHTLYIQEESRKRAEADRIAREEATRIAQEEAIQRAIELEEMGETEAAETVLSEPIQVHVQSSAPPKLEGSYGRTNYSATVSDLMTLVKAVAAGVVPLAAIEANMVYLNTRARSDRKGFSIPGVKLNEENTTNFRR